MTRKIFFSGQNDPFIWPLYLLNTPHTPLLRCSFLLQNVSQNMSFIGVWVRGMNDFGLVYAKNMFSLKCITVHFLWILERTLLSNKRIKNLYAAVFSYFHVIYKVSVIQKLFTIPLMYHKKNKSEYIGKIVM